MYKISPRWNENLIITVHRNSLSWAITRVYLLNISNDSNHCVYCARFYMFTMRRAKRRHTHSNENSIMLCAAASLSLLAVFIIVEFLSLRDIHMEHRARNSMMVKKYPPHDSSAHHPLMRSSVQIHIYAVVVITQHILCFDSPF